jgi:AraC family transcriptional regulator
MAVQHHGSHLAEKRMADLTLTEIRYPPNLTLAEHAHERACFCFIIAGSYDEHFGRRAYHCSPSTVLFRPPQEAHRDFFGRFGGHCLLIEVESNWLERVRECTSVLGQPAKLGGAPAKLALNVLRHFRDSDDLSRLAVEGIALELAAEFAKDLSSRITTKPPRWLREARDLIHSSYTQPTTLAEIGQRVGVHPVHLAREFRRHYYLTVGGYIRQQRINQACSELRSEYSSLVEIALTVGFSSQSHFTRAFKAHTGTTPGDYRRSFISRAKFGQ